MSAKAISSPNEILAPFSGNIRFPLTKVPLAEYKSYNMNLPLSIINLA
jgi:hypothetical protein